MLDIDGSCGWAYLGKVCAKFRYPQPDDLNKDDDEVPDTKVLSNGSTIRTKTKRSAYAIFKSVEFQRALEYADTALKLKLELYQKTREQFRLKRAYNSAKEQMAYRDYKSAAVAFEKLGDYSDAAQQAKICREYLLKGQDDALRKKLEQIRKRNAPVQHQMIQGLVSADCICHGPDKKWFDDTYRQGTLVSCLSVETRYDREPDRTKLYESLSERHMYGTFVYGLQTDGKITAVTGSDYNKIEYNPLSVYSMENIVRLFPAGNNMLLALDKNGGLQVAAQSWDSPLKKLADQAQWQQDLVDLSYNNGALLGLKKDGTVITGGSIYPSNYSHWKDIAALCPRSVHIALTADGQLVASSNATNLPEEIFKWTDLVAITPGYAALTADGRVLSPWRHVHHDWYNTLTDIVAISDNGKICVRADGTVLTADPNDTDWNGLRLFQSIDTVTQERRAYWSAKIAETEADCAEYRQGIEDNKGLFRRSARRSYEDLLDFAKKKLEALRQEQINL